MNIKDFKIVGKIPYEDFPLVEFMYNEIVLQDTYGLLKVKEKYNDRIITIVDIGGNLGVFSVYARKLFPNARIISLEALYDTFLSLKENTINYNIETHNIALGDGSILYLNKCVEHSGANQFRKNISQANRSEISIPSLTLKNIFDVLKIQTPYVLKMDIEGSELFLYDDLSCLEILRNAEYFAMEYHNINLLDREINKPTWDAWLKDTFRDFTIDGLGGDATGATYRIMKNG